MALPGFFVEYLISGSGAILWLLPLLAMLGVHFQRGDEAIMVLFAPSLYVLGTIVDQMGSYGLGFRKHAAGERAKKRLQNWIKHTRDSCAIDPIELWTNEPVFDLDPEFLVDAPELAKGYQAWSSRDRVLRGACVNLALAAIVDTAYFAWLGQRLYASVALPIGLGLAAVCWWLWEQAQRASYEYEIRALVAHWRLKREKAQQRMVNTQPARDTGK